MRGLDQSYTGHRSRVHLTWRVLLGLGSAFGNLAQKTPKGKS